MNALLAVFVCVLTDGLLWVSLTPYVVSPADVFIRIVLPGATIVGLYTSRAILHTQSQLGGKKKCYT